MSDGPTVVDHLKSLVPEGNLHIVKGDMDPDSKVKIEGMIYKLPL